MAMMMGETKGVMKVVMMVGMATEETEAMAAQAVQARLCHSPRAVAGAAEEAAVAAQHTDTRGTRDPGGGANLVPLPYAKPHSFIGVA